MEQPILPEMIDVVSAIEAFRAEAMIMGANDAESGDFDRIVADWRAGKISDEEALRQARAILDSKMSYH